VGIAGITDLNFREFGSKLVGGVDPNCRECGSKRLRNEKCLICDGDCVGRKCNKQHG